MPLLKTIAHSAILTLLLGTTLSMNAVEYGDYGDFSYIDYGSYIKINDFTYSRTKEVVIPENINGKPVTSIGRWAFGSNRIESIEIPSSITSIEESGINGCLNLTSISVHPQNNHYTSIAGVLFTKNLDTLITYPSGNPEAVYTVPDSVRTIPAWAFTLCGELKTINIPTSVQSVDSSAIVGCLSLEAINVDSDSNYYKSVDGVLFTKNMKTLVAYPASLAGPYTVPDGVQTIPGRAFDNCFYLTDLSIPASVRTIEPRVFDGSRGITNINIASQNSFYSSSDGVLFNKDKSTLILYPPGNTRTSYIVPESVTELVFFSIGVDSFLRHIYFLSDAPTTNQSFYTLDYFSDVESTTKYYFSDKSGFDASPWDYQSVSMGPSSIRPLTPRKMWLIENDQSHDTDLETTTNSSGKPLLLTYALNLDPETNDTPEPAISGDQLEYTFYSGRDDVTYTVEISKDLINWTSTGIILSDPNVEGYQTASANLDDSQCFVRVAVSMAE